MMVKASGIHYELIRRGRWGRLLSDYAKMTPIKGHDVVYNDGEFRCRLEPSGRLTAYRISEWDFGTRAINTPAMVEASVSHDAFCKMTDAGILPWSVRFEADKFLWTDLGNGGATISRFWRVPLVMLYSQTIARWRRKK